MPPKSRKKISTARRVTSKPATSIGKTQRVGRAAGAAPASGLSKTMSKYLGETEKELGRVLTRAERAEAVLFFDEADALLGKRTEVKDAHDRYANVDTRLAKVRRKKKK